MNARIPPSPSCTARRFPVSHSLPRRISVAALFCLFCLPTFAQTGGGAGNVFVKSRFGGFILGYDIDRNGTEGVLSESVTLGDGDYLVATETFDQKTGKILKVVTKRNHTQDDYVTFGVFGSGVGLVEHEHSTNGFVSKRTFVTMNPLDANKFTGAWTPPLKKDDIISAMSSQGSPTTAVLGFENSGNFSTFLFSSDVGANTFGKVFTLKDPNFIFNHAPVVDVDSTTNQAILGTGGGNPFGPPTMANFDLAKGKMSEYQGLGIGLVNGLAVDSNTGIACTATSIDFSVEFYNTRKKRGLLIEPLPGADNQIESGGDVVLDPVHKLFLIEQYTSNGNTNDTQPRIYVYDEKGKLKESIGGFTRIPLSPVNIAINPNTRTGFIMLDDLSELQSFTY